MAREGREVKGEGRAPASGAHWRKRQLRIARPPSNGPTVGIRFGGLPQPAASLLVRDVNDETLALPDLDIAAVRHGPCRLDDRRLLVAGHHFRRGTDLALRIESIDFVFEHSPSPTAL